MTCSKTNGFAARRLQDELDLEDYEEEDAKTMRGGIDASRVLEGSGRLPPFETVVLRRGSKESEKKQHKQKVSWSCRSPFLEK